MKMIRLVLALAPLAPLAACSDSSGYYKEEFSQYYLSPAEETRSERVQRREIVTWKGAPHSKKRLGFLHKYETLVKGSREPRECWYITDKYGSTNVGFVTAEGVFYRFDEHGRLGERLGEYPITTTGLKIFYGLPMTDNIDLQEIDPYK